jgi:hypothetical protein
MSQRSSLEMSASRKAHQRQTQANKLTREFKIGGTFVRRHLVQDRANVGNNQRDDEEDRCVDIILRPPFSHDIWPMIAQTKGLVT